MAFSWGGWYGVFNTGRLGLLFGFFKEKKPTMTKPNKSWLGILPMSVLQEKTDYHTFRSIHSLLHGTSRFKNRGFKVSNC